MYFKKENLGQMIDEKDSAINSLTNELSQINVI
jgi:hypothetical protein